MGQSSVRIGIFSAVAFLSAATVLRAETVQYSANLHTSKGNPVTDILILESDGAQVHASVYAPALPGRGISVISHDVPFVPAQTLIIGLTQGVDENGDDKTQIIMFIGENFAAAHAGIPFSSVFPGAKHSTTIANLLAAVAGDAAQLAWFTDIFFSGPAAGASFASGGPFTVAEFTFLNIIGGPAGAGSWMINSASTIAAGTMGAQDMRATAVIDETAKGDLGPFAISLTVDEGGEFALDKTVLNDTGVAWSTFRIELGKGGANFVPSMPNDGLGFQSTSHTNREETGAFPNVTIAEDVLVFSGFLPPGGTAHFVVFVDVGGGQTVTLRQIALQPQRTAPAASPWSLAVAAMLLMALELRRRLQASPPARRSL